MTHKILPLVAIATSVFALIECDLEAQTYRRDYRIDAPINYQASDPWTRGFIYRSHINHAGKFYNCDDEECKRYSPYIFYTQANRDCKTRTIDYVRRQVSEVKWRLDAGKCCDPCDYPGCDCEPNVNLSCIVHPNSVDIDYSDLSRHLARIGPRQPVSGYQTEDSAPGENRTPSIDPVEIYRGNPNRSGGSQQPSPAPKAKDQSNRIRLHPSLLKNSQSQNRTQPGGYQRVARQPQSVATQTAKTLNAPNQVTRKRGPNLLNKWSQQWNGSQNEKESSRLFAEPPFQSYDSTSNQKKSENRLLRSALIPIQRNRK